MIDRYQAILRRPMRMMAMIMSLLGVVYVGNAWSPSSYGLVLRMVEAASDGVVLGSPKPRRSDEYAVWTPYIQIAVLNDFKQYNDHSIYNENLRNFNSSPIADWSAVFKPQQWGFFILDPAYAFSLYHYIIIAVFILGYYKFATCFGFSPPYALAFSGLAFFSGYAQFWWTTTGPVIAIFPWVVIAFLGRYPALIKAAVFYWISTAWMLSHFYPPIIISLAFFGAVMVLAFRPDALNIRDPRARSGMLAVVVGGALAVGTVYAYFGDMFAIMAATEYPGRRINDGGIGADIRIWAGTFLPFSRSMYFGERFWHHFVETGAVGSLLPILILIFVDHSALSAMRDPTFRRDPGTRLALRRLVILLVALTLTSLWFLAPIPAWIGQVLLWDKVFPQRMIYVIGLLALVMSLQLVRILPWRITPPRIGVLIAASIAIWLVSARLGHVAPLRHWAELIVVLPALVVLFLALRRRLTSQDAQRGAVLAMALTVNVAAFGSYNPIQSAHPIFRKPETAITEAFDRFAADRSDGWLVFPNAPFFGAIMAGWGYKTVAHTLMAPRVEFFRPYFPDLSPDELNRIFNRYAHILVRSIDEPRVANADAVEVPVKAFGPSPSRKVDLRSGASDADGEGLPERGSIDGLTVRDGTVSLNGWGAWTGYRAGQRIEVVAPPGSVAASDAQVVMRTDLRRAFPSERRLFAGFEMTLTVPGTFRPEELCLIGHDVDGRAFRIPGQGTCAARPVGKAP